VSSQTPDKNQPLVEKPVTCKLVRKKRIPNEPASHNQTKDKVHKGESWEAKHQPAYPGALLPLYPIYYQYYNLWIQLEGPNQQAYSEWEAILAFMIHLTTRDPIVILLPWKAQDELK